MVNTTAIVDKSNEVDSVILSGFEFKFYMADAYSVVSKSSFIKLVNTNPVIDNFKGADSIMFPVFESKASLNLVNSASIIEKIYS